ncbi:MAG: type IX secretion system membrane protein PorP/SprF [Bacteroidales bacterium]|nr:type IX secretion system membrane protein PorP/SprF [Bacteroidales bacterium]
MMKKLVIISILVINCVLKVSSQTDPLYTQFMTNPFLINPALAGTYPYYQVIANSRLQWTVLPDPPVNNVLSMYGPTVSKPMGFGGFIAHETWGLTSKTTLMASYAYNYNLAEDLKIAMGLSVGILQFKIEGTEKYGEWDPVYQGQTFTDFAPDASVGVYLYSTTYHVGLASTHLFGNRLNIGEEADTVTGLSRLSRNFYIHGGYKYFINQEMAIEPTVILRQSPATPMQVDINVRYWYGKRKWENTKIWAGVSFRSQDAINILAGVTIKRKIEIGYSYDIGINKLRTFHYGSHELMFGFKFNDIKEY